MNTLEKNIQFVKEQQLDLLSQLPKDLDERERKMFIEGIGSIYEGIYAHLNIIEHRGLKLGESLACPLNLKQHEDYRYHLNRIGIHFEDAYKQLNIAKQMEDKKGKKRRDIYWNAIRALTVRR